MSDLKVFSTRIDPTIKKALKHLSIDTDKSITDLTEEAFKDLLKKYRKQAPLKD
jgi:hypothetical protein